MTLEERITSIDLPVHNVRNMKREMAIALICKVVMDAYDDAAREGKKYSDISARHIVREATGRDYVSAHDEVAICDLLSASRRALSELLPPRTCIPIAEQYYERDGTVKISDMKDEEASLLLAGGYRKSAVGFHLVLDVDDPLLRVEASRIVKRNQGQVERYHRTIQNQLSHEVAEKIQIEASSEIRERYDERDAKRKREALAIAPALEGIAAKASR